MQPGTDSIGTPHIWFGAAKEFTTLNCRNSSGGSLMSLGYALLCAFQCVKKAWQTRLKTVMIADKSEKRRLRNAAKKAQAI